jgi:hypothetical protein
MFVLEEYMRFLIEEEKKYKYKINEIEKQFGSLSPQALPHKILLRKIKLAQEQVAQEQVTQSSFSELMCFLVEEEKKHQNNIDEIDKQFDSLAF